MVYVTVTQLLFGNKCPIVLYKSNARQWYDLYGQVLRNFSLNVIRECKVSGRLLRVCTQLIGWGQRRMEKCESLSDNLRSEREEEIYLNLKA